MSEERSERREREKPPAVVWPDPCARCADHPGLRELAWHRTDRRGVATVDTMMAACDCARGAAVSDRSRDYSGQRTIGTLTEVWDRLAARREHIALHVDPTLAQRTPASAPRSTTSEAIAFVRASVLGRGAA